MFIQQPSSQQVKLQHGLQLLGRSLRNHPTQAEAMLWRRLKHKQLGYKFRRQYPLFRFIVDFYCSHGKLIIELDGGIHDTRKEYDALRDQYLHQAGYTVLRFSNETVISSLEDVIKIIQFHLNKSPLQGETQRGNVGYVAESQRGKAEYVGDTDG